MLEIRGQVYNHTSLHSPHTGIHEDAYHCFSSDVENLSLEDIAYIFTLADFGYSDANDLVGAQASRLHADGDVRDPKILGFKQVAQRQSQKYRSPQPVVVQECLEA